MEVSFIHALQGAPSYQARPELDRIEAWWRAQRPGVCALVGLGGTGKTALAERFLSLGRDDASAAFVFSFYEQPIVEEFFAALGAWIGMERKDAAHLEVLEALARSDRRRLLVLDGLERVQSDGAGAELGEIENVPLRDLLMRASTGLLGIAAVLTTTRFPIAPLDRTPSFVRIDIDRLSEESGFALARRRGARGTDDDIRRMVASCGCHALLVDLVAACSAELGEDPQVELDEVDRAVLAQVRPERRPAAELQRRFAGTMRRYRKLLESKEPDAWALLRIACSFRNAVNQETLSALRSMETSDVSLTLLVDPDLANRFQIAAMLAEEAQKRDELGIGPRVAPRGEYLIQYLGEPLTPDAGWLRMTFRGRFDEAGELEIAPAPPSPSATSAEATVSKTAAWSQMEGALQPWLVGLQIEGAVRDVRDAFKRAARAGPSLELLQRLGLIDAREGRVLVHPAVRDGLAHDQDQDELIHRRALAFLSSSILSAFAVPRLLPSVQVEEMVHHMIGAGESSLAWTFYHQRLGFLWLAVKRAAYAQGEALLRMFVGGASPLEDRLPNLHPKQQAAFFNEWGLYLHRLGQLRGASACFRRAAELAARIERPWFASVALQSLSETELLMGTLPAARSSLLSAARMMGQGGEPPERTPAEEAFARDSVRERLPNFIAYGAGIERLELEQRETIDELLHRGAWPEAERLCRFGLIGARVYHHEDESVHHAHLSLVLAETNRAKGDRVRALGHVRLAREWALAHGERELLARAYLESAQTADDRTSAHWIAEGRRIALDSGFGAVLIDLALVRAERAIMAGDRTDAAAAIALALEGSSEEGWLGARDPRSGYVRGELRARELSRRLGSERPRSERPRGRILVTYGYRDSQWLEELLRHLEAAGVREGIDLWHDGLEEPPPPAGKRRAIVLTSGRFECPEPMAEATKIHALFGGSEADQRAFSAAAKKLATALTVN